MTDKKSPVPAKKKKITTKSKKPAANPASKRSASANPAKPKRKSPTKKTKIIEVKEGDVEIIPQEQLDKEKRGDIKTRFQPGNQLWRQVKNPGRNANYKTPEQLWNKVIKYFDWADNTLLEEEKLFSFQGNIHRGSITKLRPYTMQGMTVYIELSTTSWDIYKKKPEFIRICEYIEKIIYEQKFSGATADLMNHAIIIRELGLADKKEVDIPPGSELSDLMKIISGTGLRPVENPEDE